MMPTLKTGKQLLVSLGALDSDWIPENESGIAGPLGVPRFESQKNNLAKIFQNFTKIKKNMNYIEMTKDPPAVV